MANKSTQPAANGSNPAVEKVEQIKLLESEIEAKRAEIDRLRTSAENVEENRDELNETAAPSSSALREESFGQIIVLWEQPGADEGRGGLKKIAIGRDRRVPADGAVSRSTDTTTLPDMVYASSFESDETSVESAHPPSHPPSPRSPAGLFGHLLRPFGSPETKTEASSPSSRRRAGGLVEHLFLPPGSPRNISDSSETEVVKVLVEERDQKIASLEETIACDTRAMRQMKETIERLSVELLTARRSEKLFRALGSRSSSLEDEVEKLRVENTKLRIACQELEEDRKRVEGEMRTELELLCLETGRPAGYF